MNKDLLFQVEHIWLQWEISIFSVLISFFLSIFIFHIFNKKNKKTKNNQIKIKEKIIFPELNDKNFEEKIFLSLQYILQQKYFTQNIHSYTNIDIAKYCNNKNIIQIYKNLEQIIYTKKILNNIEKQEFLEKIKNLE